MLNVSPGTAVAVDVGEGVAVAVGAGVAVAVGTGVAVAVGCGVGVAVTVGCGVGVVSSTGASGAAPWTTGVGVGELARMTAVFDRAAWALRPAAFDALTWNWYSTPGSRPVTTYVSPVAALSMKNSVPSGDIRTR
jgi:hypothetical protein